MCTLALYFRELEDYPLIIAANRDESFTRPSDPPRLLADTPLILAGKDLLAGGTWLGVNDHGLLAGILNRRTDTKKEPGTLRSRGLLCLDILRLKDPQEARGFLKSRSGSIYQPFNLLFANEDQACVAYNLGEEIAWVNLEKGLHVLGNASVYDTRSEKMERAYLLFSEARERIRRESNSQLSWIRAIKEVLSDHGVAKHSSDPKDSICVHTQSYGTVSSSIIFYARAEKSFYSYHASGPPCREDYGEPLSLKVL